MQTAAHFEELGGNPKKGFLVGGISAGGNFGTIVTHLYRDEKLFPPLTGAYLSIPACIPPGIVPKKYEPLYLSREQNKEAPILNQETIDLFESKKFLSLFSRIQADMYQSTTMQTLTQIFGHQCSSIPTRTFHLHISRSVA